MQNSKEIKTAKKIERNTLRIEYTDGSIAIRLHGTDIITLDPEGNTIFNSDGFKTNVTKSRMCRYGLVNIKQSNNTWFINFKGKDGKDAVTEFYDGIKFTSDLRLIGEEIKCEPSKIQKSKRSFSNLITIMVKGNQSTSNNNSFEMSNLAMN